MIGYVSINLSQGLPIYLYTLYTLINLLFHAISIALMVSENEGAVGDCLAEITESIRHTLETPAVVRDGQVTLDKVPELGVEVEDPCLPVAEKLRLNGEPSGAGGGTALHDDVDEVVGNGAVEPRPDDAVHAPPIRRGHSGNVAKNVIL